MGVAVELHLYGAAESYTWMWKLMLSAGERRKNHERQQGEAGQLASHDNGVA